MYPLSGTFAGMHRPIIRLFVLATAACGPSPADSDSPCTFDPDLGCSCPAPDSPENDWDPRFLDIVEVGRCDLIYEWQDLDRPHFFVADQDQFESGYGRFFATDGAHIGTYSWTDEADPDPPPPSCATSDTVWLGEPPAESPPWNSRTEFTWPECGVFDPLTDVGPVPEVGLLTGSSTLAAAVVDGEARCLARTACSTPDRSLIGFIRVSYGRSLEMDRDRPVSGSADVFWEDTGELAGTADLVEKTANGTFPIECLEAFTPTSACLAQPPGDTE